jgi:hypothetical protein
MMDAFIHISMINVANMMNPHILAMTHIIDMLASTFQLI